LRAHGRCGASATPLKFSPARPEQAGKKEKGFRSTSPQGIFARLSVRRRRTTGRWVGIRVSGFLPAACGGG